jgi:outer membrane protein assembly factor BamB
MKKVISILFILPMILSCVLVSTPPVGETNFPLQQVASIPVDGEIQQIAVADTWIAVSTYGHITALDKDSQQILWDLDFNALNEENRFQMVNDTVIASSYDQIILIDKNGQKKEIVLSPQKDSNNIIKIAAVTRDYLYVVRGSSWILEAYDSSKNALVWETPVGRGGADNVFYDPTSGSVYIVGGSVSALENLNGNLLWEQEEDTLLAAFEDGILYVYEEVDPKDNYRIVAIDVRSREELWTKDFVFSPASGINQLTIIDNLLIASAGKLIALDKSNGDQIWSASVGETFYTAPIKFDGNLYVMGGVSSTAFAISPDDGSVIGTANLDGDENLFSADPLSKVHTLDDGIVFNTKLSVVIYKTK